MLNSTNDVTSETAKTPLIDNDFYGALLNEIMQNITNDYSDNFDFYRFKSGKIKSVAKKFVRMVTPQTQGIAHNFKSLHPYMSGLKNFYNLLNDEQSKELLVKLVAYRVLTFKKYKLPLSTTEFWQGIKKVEQTLKPLGPSTSVRYPGGDIELVPYDLALIGLPIKLFTVPISAYYLANVRQYEYKTTKTSIMVEKDDVVIDCGACWGDTTLLFASQGARVVYGFEFVPGNIKVFNQNVEMNPTLKDRVKLVSNPLSEKSGQDLYYVDLGPGSRVSSEPFPGSQKITTLSIDDLVTQNSLSKVDFIKMDIEGAEPFALKGAVQTIKKFRPKLAISIYHSMSDFVNIVSFINSLNLGYSFYLNHGTIHSEETVLMAKVES